ncbi:MAG: D-amino-acid transaminase [Minwuia sp.]|nr:D-amino-acid transaminase [Minwuia sp.]
MGRVAFVNGQYVPHGMASVHVEDRGYQFADGVYEVIPVIAGRQVDGIGHRERLARSLRELRIDPPMTDRALGLVVSEVIRRNRVRTGHVYLQITRGVAPRDHAFPADPESAIVVYANSKAAGGIGKQADEGVRVITAPDQRWARCDIKTVGLLPNCLAKQAAREAGAHEAFLYDEDGHVTEGSSTNAWIVDAEGRLVTRPVSHEILNGITRLSLMELVADAGIEVVERAFTVEELLNAREVFLTSASALATPVIQVDDRVIGNGRPGSVTSRLVEMLRAYVSSDGVDAAAGKTI